MRKAATLFKRTGVFTEMSYFGPREACGQKRRSRRMFWRAHRADTRNVINESLADMNAPEAPDNTFAVGAQRDAYVSNLLQQWSDVLSAIMAVENAISVIQIEAARQIRPLEGELDNMGECLRNIEYALNDEGTSAYYED